jgi:hypothetical protein
MCRSVARIAQQTQCRYYQVRDFSFSIFDLPFSTKNEDLQRNLHSATVKNGFLPLEFMKKIVDIFLRKD